MSIASTPAAYKGYDPHSPLLSFRNPHRWSVKTTALFSVVGYIKDHTIGYIKSWTQRPIRPLIYHTSSTAFKKTLDPARLEQSRAILRSIGGENIVLETHDNVKLDCMFFSARNFKTIIEAQGGRFDFINVDGKKQAVLIPYNQETIKLLEDMNASFYPDIPCVRMYNAFDSDHEEHGFDMQHNHPVVSILTQGNGSIYEFNRELIIKTLLTGQDCMVFNIRGTGRSTGNPTERGSYNDVETVYQYLTHERHFLISNIHINGYCLGSGLASELAALHPMVNLTLDRPFARLSNVIAQIAVEPVFPKNSNFVINGIQKIVKTSLNTFVRWFVISYDNLSKIKKVQNQICIIDGTEDTYVPQGDIASLRKAAEGQELTNLSAKGGHFDNWDDDMRLRYSAEYLKKAELVRSFGRSPYLTIISQRVQDACISVTLTCQKCNLCKYFWW